MRFHFSFGLGGLYSEKQVDDILKKVAQAYELLDGEREQDTSLRAVRLTEEAMREVNKVSGSYCALEGLVMIHNHVTRKGFGDWQNDDGGTRR